MIEVVSRTDEALTFKTSDGREWSIKRPQYLSVYEFYTMRKILTNKNDLLGDMSFDSIAWLIEEEAPGATKSMTQEDLADFFAAWNPELNLGK